MAYTPLPPPSRAMVPADQAAGDLPVPASGWGPPVPVPPIGASEPATPWHRYLAALKRFRWLIAACFVLGGVGGYAATRFVTPEYEARATISLAVDSRRGQSQTGPIQADELLNPASWEQLFRSRRIIDSVVFKRRLYLQIGPSDTAALANFTVAPRYTQGSFELRTDAGAHTYLLSTAGSNSTVVDHGQVGDSIGRSLGFRWRPSRTALDPAHVVRFSVSSLSSVSQGLEANVVTSLPDNSQIMSIALTGSHSWEAAATLNEWLDQFIIVAADLKGRKITELTSILATQLQFSDARLKEAERALQDYETRQIADATSATVVGSHQPLAVSGGAPSGEQVTNYYGMKLQRENLNQDIARVQQLLGAGRQGAFNPEDLLAVPSLMIGSDNLRAAIQSYSTKQGELRDLKLKYTEEYKPVRDLQAAITILQTQTIPQLAAQSLTRLRTQDQTLAQRINNQAGGITQLPTAAIEDMRRRRAVDQAAMLYNTLQTRYEEAKLAEASAIPDVQILDRAAAPSYPSRNTKPRVFGMTIFAGLGLGLALALLLDRIDPRVRYPEQATNELGLPIIGAVPTMRERVARQRDEEEASQLVEAFRTIRLNLLHLFDPAAPPMMLAVSSPGPGEGKSLVSSNLAMSFAESGRRTLLIDGDIRRGQLHVTFGIHQAPGVLDFLTGSASLEEVLQLTDYENLTVVSCGTRRHRGPELVASDGMLQFLHALRPHFDTIIIDTPPLGVGIDPFALGVAAGNMVVILRVGRSNRQMAQAKLAVLDRYPLRVLGAILNDVKTEGAFRSYAYLYGYKLDDGDRGAALPKVSELAAPQV